jgi:energy-coupling factor transporter ATP-binding protein EcfA2
MSDKSVKKTLDWPTHDDHQDKPPEFGKWTSTTGPTWKRDEEYTEPEGVFMEKCQSCGGTGVNEITGRKCTYCRGTGHTPKYEEEVKHLEEEIAKLEQGEGQDPSQQLDPTQQQNQTPLGQGQFMPTSTIGYVNIGKSDEATDIEAEIDAAMDVVCPKCAKESLLGPTGYEITLDQKGWLCPYCGYVVPIANEDELYEFIFESEEWTTEDEDEFEVDEDLEMREEATDDEGEEMCPKHNKTYNEHSLDELDDDVIDPDKSEEEGPLTDPREREKELNQPDKEPGEGLSPEAQKIAGTDPASMKTKEKEKPKLEVDVDQRITVLGASGSGKTNLIKVLMSDILPDYRFVLLDSIGNFAEYDGQPNIEYHLVNPSDTEDVDQIIYSALEKGDCMVVIDEIDRYKSEKGTMVNELVNLGRNYGVGGIFAARRTADVNKDVLANSPYIFTFQHILPQDLSVLIDWFAQDEAVFRNLQKFEAILFKDGEQIWVGKVPEKETTKPTKKPPMPKKPKGGDQKGKGPEQKGQPGVKQPPPSTGESGEPQQGQPQEKEPQQKGPSQKTPELTPVDEKDQAASEKSEARYADEAPFMCDVDGQRFKYESDFEDHMIREHAY